jgi:glycosyltransferase involved in cell wall biosynthesis
MNIIMVTNNTLEDKVGGHERGVRELSTALVARGHRVTIVAKRRSAGSREREECPDGVVLERYPVPAKSNPLFGLLYPAFVALGVLARTSRPGKGTVLHAHMGLPALPLALRQKPFVFTFHAPVWRELLSERQSGYLLPPLAQKPAVRALRAVEAFVAARATRTVVLSEFMRAELAALNRHAGQEAVLVQGGIDARRFAAAGNLRANGRSEQPLLFTARRLTPRTGVDQLIRAIPEITASWPDARLQIAGTGPMEPALKSLAREIGASHAVDFLGRITDQQLVNRYCRASLVVMPTQELEGFGLTTVEALACGAPVVGTPVGATPELLRGVDPALVTSDASPAAIASAVLRLLDDPARLRQISEVARSRVVPAMTWERVADRYIELYETLI